MADGEFVRLDAVIEGALEIGKPKNLPEKMRLVADECLLRHITRREAMAAFDKQLLRAALARTNGNVCEAAKVLGEHRNMTSRHGEKHKVSASEFKVYSRGRA